MCADSDHVTITWSSGNVSEGAAFKASHTLRSTNSWSRPAERGTHWIPRCRFRFTGTFIHAHTHRTHHSPTSNFVLKRVLRGAGLWERKGRKIAFVWEKRYTPQIITNKICGLRERLCERPGKQAPVTPRAWSLPCWVLLAGRTLSSPALIARVWSNEWAIVYSFLQSTNTVSVMIAGQSWNVGKNIFLKLLCWPFCCSCPLCWAGRWPSGHQGSQCVVWRRLHPTDLGLGGQDVGVEAEQQFSGDFLIQLLFRDNLDFNR